MRENLPRMFAIDFLYWKLLSGMCVCGCVHQSIHEGASRALWRDLLGKKQKTASEQADTGALACFITAMLFDLGNGKKRKYCERRKADYRKRN
jgi:hypothetical protein